MQNLPGQAGCLKLRFIPFEQQAQSLLKQALGGDAECLRSPDWGGGDSVCSALSQHYGLQVRALGNYENSN